LRQKKGDARERPRKEWISFAINRGSINLERKWFLSHEEWKRVSQGKEKFGIKKIKF